LLQVETPHFLILVPVRSDNFVNAHSHMTSRLVESVKLLCLARGAKWWLPHIQGDIPEKVVLKSNSQASNPWVHLRRRKIYQ